MRIRYDPEADVLLLVLRDGPPVAAVGEPGGVVVSYGDDGEPVSVEFLNASALLFPVETQVEDQSLRDSTQDRFRQYSYHAMDAGFVYGSDLVAKGAGICGQVTLAHRDDGLYEPLLLSALD